jgi:hypothetical protein
MDAPAESTLTSPSWMASLAYFDQVALGAVRAETPSLSVRLLLYRFVVSLPSIPCCLPLVCRAGRNRACSALAGRLRRAVIPAALGTAMRKTDAEAADSARPEYDADDHGACEEKDRAVGVVGTDAPNGP